ncbi:transposase [Epibacterium mobile]|nr:transposase [Tritonibacter mobilis]
MLLLISHVIARGQAKASGEEALVDASVVVRRAGISKWLAYYNAERPNSTHGILTPD